MSDGRVGVVHVRDGSRAVVHDRFTLAGMVPTLREFLCCLLLFLPPLINISRQRGGGRAKLINSS